jgi:hypothetical protein
MPKPTLHIVSSKDKSEGIPDSLTRRYGRAAREPEQVVYEFTSDKAMLHQYFRIREIMYRKIHHTKKFKGKQDWHDKIGHILIARRGKLCIGGCRLIIREGDEDFLLPMESDHFDVRQAFSNLPLKKMRHGEISRFAVMDDDEQQQEIMLALSQLIIDKCVNEDLGYVFLKCPGTVMARNWRKIIHAHCGQRDVNICSDVVMPHDVDYPEIQWLLIKATLPAGKVTAVSAETARANRLMLPEDSIVH